jgi:hypothetical protein
MFQDEARGLHCPIVEDPFMSMIKAGAAAAILLASGFGAMALSTEAAKSPSGVTLVQSANPQTPDPQAKAQKPVRRKTSAHHRRGHKSATLRMSRRNKSAMRSSKRTGTKAQKGVQKAQRPS